MEKETKQDRERHRHYMKVWREQKKVKDAQRLEDETDEVYNCKKFRNMIQNLIPREEAFMVSHFNACSNCRFWIREIQHKQDRKEELEDPFNPRNWQTPEPEREEKLDPNNKFLEDMWKNHGKDF